MVLSALGILMVVDHHTFTALNLFGDYIPYNSFFMPMFVFISGYFNKVDSSTKLLPYFGKKIKNQEHQVVDQQIQPREEFRVNMLT